MATNRYLLATAALLVALSSAPASAETLNEAMASAFSNNPTLNSQRAATRATDEGVPQALSGYRPRVDAFAQGGIAYIDPAGPADGSRRSLSTGITITQPIFTGFRTENGVKAAEAAVLASRQALRNTEQNVLYDAVQAYMDVVRDQAILGLRRSNLDFLNEQVRAASDRFEVGEGTRTDVAQAEAAVAAATSAISFAQANLQASIGVYEQVIGHPPKNLKSAKGVDYLLPKSLDAAIAAARGDHPAILSSVFSADVAAFNVKIIEGELLPSISIEGSVSRSWEDGFGANSGTNAQVVGRLSIPIYEGGQTYSRVREAKETLGQRKIEIDVARDQVQASLIAAWGGLQAAKSQITAARAQIEALQLALNGVIEEQRVGQRTTLDVLEAQNDVIEARVSQVQAERDAVVASYAILSATGRLSVEKLALAVRPYDPKHHYQQVRDKWIGLRTPDGR